MPVPNYFQSYYPQQGFYQNAAGNYQHPAGPSTQNTQLTFVNGVDGARSYPAPVNSSVILMDNDSNTFYIKSTDNVGLCTIRKFQFSEIPVENQETGKTDSSEISKLSSKIDTLIDILTVGKEEKNEHA